MGSLTRPPLDTLASLGLSSEALSENLHQGLIVTDPDGVIEFVNSTFSAVTGYESFEVLGKNPRLLRSGKQSPAFYQRMWKAITQTGYWEGEVQNRRKNGEIYTEWLAISALKNDLNQIVHYLGVFSDISKRKEAELATWHKANHDPLTGLPNRSLATALLKQALAQARRNQTLLAVIFLDLDHLKEVNDSLGHFAGDRLLTTVVSRLRQTIREGDILSRFGGDEFVLIIPGLGDRTAISWIAHKILLTLRKPFALGGRAIKTAGSMGISIFPDDGRSANTLIARADHAMYAAKKAGRDRFHFFAPNANRSEDRDGRSFQLL